MVNLRGGLREFLRLGSFSGLDPGKSVLIEREIGNGRSGRVYGEMICDIVQEAASETRTDPEEYELVLPTKKAGAYLAKTYNHHNIDSAIFMESLDSALDFEG